MVNCPDCGSRFFKTLEVRFESLKEKIQALLYKKRCKRCKHIYLVKLSNQQGKPYNTFVSTMDWQKAHKISSYAGLFLAAGERALVGDYTRLISSDTSSAYRNVLKPR